MSKSIQQLEHRRLLRISQKLNWIVIAQNNNPKFNFFVIPSPKKSKIKFRILSSRVVTWRWNFSSLKNVFSIGDALKRLLCIAAALSLFICYCTELLEFMHWSNKIDLNRKVIPTFQNTIWSRKLFWLRISPFFISG